ncbi:hypothetical protein HFO65_29980 [Rhizobium laguerreae]|uniref:hypothetical protein n=1 Tax=Rhizobium laguerreae TaxID=1076926 RepID=UPI001C8FA979|nr:hypothetical protein [Rhizobium laguerreae]MBY3094914.1 hypothetical protein [Rhizobium laguerreae]MBY3164824.1 hypothetical protein [Rhizobium laguerreae]
MWYKGERGGFITGRSKTLTDENKRFVEVFANPNAWLMMADNLHEQATEIYRGRSGSTIITKVNANQEILRQTRAIDKSVFLLGGFALENAIKAFLVYENPQWVSNGHLSSKLRSHSLSGLQKQSKLIPYKQRYLHVLEAFESGLDSWFRYPCALTVQDSKEEDHLFDDLWDGYCKVMRAYGKKLKTLLGDGWNGPHGWYGRWKIQGPSLGYGEPLSTRRRVTQSPSNQETVKGKVSQ